MRPLLILTFLLTCFSPLSAEMIYDSGSRTAPCTIPLPDLCGHSLSLAWALSQTDANKAPLGIHIVNADSDTLSIVLSSRQIHDPLYDREEFAITMALSAATEEYTAKIPDSRYLSGGIVAFTLETNSNRYPSPSIALLSGTSQPSPFFHTQPDSSIAATFLSPDAPALREIIIDSPGLTIHRSALRYTPLPLSFSTPPLSDAEIAGGIKERDPHSGYWTQLDYDTDGTLLRPGGRYTIALIHNEASGGYDIIYIDGANINPGQWRTGMSKGSLTALSHEGIYAVQWIDATGEPLPCHAEAQFTDASTLIITFPELNSSLRFLRSR